MCQTTSRFTPTWLAQLQDVFGETCPSSLSTVACFGPICSESDPTATEKTLFLKSGTNKQSIFGLNSIFICVPFVLQSSKDAVGFIGLGNMGAPMANNLLAKGYPLVVYDIVESCVEGAVRNGAVKATSPAEVRINDIPQLI